MRRLGRAPASQSPDKRVCRVITQARVQRFTPRRVRAVLLALSMLSAACGEQAEDDGDDREIGVSVSAQSSTAMREIMFVIDGSTEMGGQCTTFCPSPPASREQGGAPQPPFVYAGPHPAPSGCYKMCDPKTDYGAQRDGLKRAISAIPVGTGYAVGVVLSGWGDFDQCARLGPGAPGCSGAPHYNVVTRERWGAPRLVVPLTDGRSDGAPASFR